MPLHAQKQNNPLVHLLVGRGRDNASQMTNKLTVTADIHLNPQMDILPYTYFITISSWELCRPKTERKCENKKRNNCRYKYRTVYKDVYEDVCEEVNKKVCSKVRHSLYLLYLDTHVSNCKFE